MLKATSWAVCVRLVANRIYCVVAPTEFTRFRKRALALISYDLPLYRSHEVVFTKKRSIYSKKNIYFQLNTLIDQCVHYQRAIVRNHYSSGETKTWKLNRFEENALSIKIVCVSCFCRMSELSMKIWQKSQLFTQNIICRKITNTKQNKNNNNINNIIIIMDKKTTTRKEKNWTNCLCLLCTLVVLQVCFVYGMIFSLPENINWMILTEHNRLYMCRETNLKIVTETVLLIL